MFAFALAIIISFSIFAWSFKSTPVVTIEDVSVNPNTTHVNNLVELSLTLQNNDQANSHQVELKFESHSLVTFILGNERLPTSGGAYIYGTVLSPSAKLTQPFKVSASLEQGIAELSYQITIRLYVDGAQLDTKKLTLKVQV